MLIISKDYLFNSSFSAVEKWSLIDAFLNHVTYLVLLLEHANLFNQPSSVYRSYIDGLVKKNEEIRFPGLVNTCDLLLGS